MIEADAGGPGSQPDAARDRWLAAQGFRVLRLWNSDVLGNLAGTLDLITRTAQPIDPHPLI